MDQKTTNELDRLLADGELSGPEADAIFDRVHASVVAAERPRWPARAALLGGLVAAAAALQVLVWTQRDAGGELAARGSAAHAPALEATCSDGTLAACPLSSKLVFVVGGDAPAGYLSAYAESIERGAERVWYFSREAGSPELTPSNDGTHVFERAVMLAGSHRPGRYRVHAFFAKKPLGRGEMLAGASGISIINRVQMDVTVIAGK